MIRFCTEGAFGPSTKEAKQALQTAFDLLTPYCQDFFCKKGRGPLLLILGKQHHGKSSLLNHFKRCLSGQMDIPNEVEAAPPSDMETTIRTTCLSVPFGKHSFTFCDAPAFANMGPERKRDLNSLLWRTGSGFGRGDWSAWPNPPDAVIIVVSLLSFRDERDSLADYLKELQAVLKTQRTTNQSAVFPFVVALTHKDKFLEDSSNNGKDPLAELSKAERDLKSLANTEAVFTITNYTRSSWWAPEVTMSTFRMLSEATNLAKNRVKTSSEAAPGYCLWLVLFFLVLAFLAANGK